MDAVLPEPAVGQIWHPPEADMRHTSRSVVNITDMSGTMLIGFRRHQGPNLEYARREQFLKWARRVGVRVVSQ